MSLAFDEFGRPFIIIREQEKKKRTKGMEAHKVSKRSRIMQFGLFHRMNPSEMLKFKVSYIWVTLGGKKHKSS
jgi:hypothetical protein